MASHSYRTLGFSLLQEIGSNKFIKKSRGHVVLIDTLQLNAFNLDAVTLASLKRQKKTRVKYSPKKQNQKIRDRENDLCKRNHFYACESLLSLMAGNVQNRKIIMISLKKSCEDLSELLIKCSISIAGIGIAVFCNVASRRVPFCADKVFETSLSFSLVMLSWAVCRLREAIVDVNRKAIKDEEMTNRVERRIKGVYLRAAIVISMIVLRFR